MNIEDRWFSGLRAVEVPGFTNPMYFHTRAKLLSAWDEVEVSIRDYLSQLQNADLDKVFDEPFYVWQVLLHVVNHATDHRAQTFALLHNLGPPTFPQDLVFIVMEIDITSKRKRG